MAYLNDDQNELIGTGDLLSELDSELDELKATLGELEAAEGATQPKDAQHTDKAADDSRPSPAASIEIPDTIDLSATTGDIPSPALSADSAPRHGKGRRPLYRTLAAVGVIAALVAVLLLLKPFGLSNADGSADPTASGDVVTINDSELGEFEIQTVPGAKINTYDEENLVTDSNGYLAYYEDGKKISSIGIDLSEYQTGIDFDKVKAAGVDFVMLRVGGRYYSEEGGLYADGAFTEHYRAAKAAGLKVGAYFFSQAADVDDAVEEAQFALEQINGVALDYPIAFDWETIEDDTARTDVVTGEMLTEIAEAFCDTVEQAGYRSIVYANTALMLHMYDFETMKDYDFWLADYRDFPNMYYHFSIWQYTTEGTVDGIDGTVDLNLCFADYK